MHLSFVIVCIIEIFVILQCSDVNCKESSNYYTLGEIEFVNEISSYGNNTFECFYGVDKVVLRRLYSTFQFVNLLFWPSVAWLIAIVGFMACVFCFCCQRQRCQNTYTAILHSRVLLHPVDMVSPIQLSTHPVASASNQSTSRPVRIHQVMSLFDE